MEIKCTECNMIYDDVYSITYCPHNAFQMNTTVIKSNGDSKICTTVEELDEFIKNN